MSDIRPTPETSRFMDSLHGYSDSWEQFAQKVEDFSSRLERQRDEAQEQLEAMRDAIKEAHRVLENAFFVHQATTTYAPQDAVDKIENQKHCDNMKEALCKLQPFLKP